MILKIYIAISILFGLYGMLMQKMRHPNFAQWQNQLEVFLLNSIFFPICLVIAIVKKTLIPYNLIKAIKDQGPLKRAFRNFFITGNAWGLFSINSHIRQDTQKPKVIYNTKETALKSAEAMGKKKDIHFSVYKCAYCNGYHLGRNRENK